MQQEDTIPHGPYFPYYPQGASFEAQKTLRDEFAIAALTGLIGGRKDFSHPEMTTKFIAEVAYEFADAMLEARRAK